MIMRYPGGKSKFKKHIIPLINELSANHREVYVEPFLGSGAIAIAVMKLKIFERYIFADKDFAMVSLWRSILHHPQSLTQRIKEISPSVDLFYSLKEHLSKPSPYLMNNFSELQLACMKIAIHQISYSGLGPKAGGPIGGKLQKSAYKVDCRWNPIRISKDINKIHDLLKYNNVQDNDILYDDFEQAINRAEIHNSFYYLDPPYFEHGNSLYKCGFSLEDHKRLFSVIREDKNRWLVSYDDADFINKLYENFEIIKIPMKCTINGSHSKNELLISNERSQYTCEI